MWGGSHNDEPCIKNIIYIYIYILYTVRSVLVWFGLLVIETRIEPKKSVFKK